MGVNSLNNLCEMAVTWHDQDEKNRRGPRTAVGFILGNVEALERDFVLWKLPGRWCFFARLGDYRGRQYLAWKSGEEKLEPAQGIPFMIQNQVLETIVQLEATIVAPSTLQQFHSTHRQVEQGSGETVAFLMSLLCRWGWGT